MRDEHNGCRDEEEEDFEEEEEEGEAGQSAAETALPRAL